MFVNKMRVGLSIALSASLIASAIGFCTNISAKAKPAVKTIKLKVGEKKTIKIKGKKKKAKYIFASSAKKKATVSKKGVVTAKKAGNVTIIVKEKTKSKAKSIGKVKVIITNKSKEATQPTNTPETTQPTNAPSNTPVATATAEPTAEPTIEPTPGPTAEPVVNKVESVSYDSTVVSEGETIKRNAMVVLPNGYTTEKKYPVVYMLHGIFGNEKSLYGDKTQNVFWNAQKDGTLKDCIAVFPNACANKTGGSVGDNGGHNAEHYGAYDNFINDLTVCLMPYMKANYSILEGRENTAICGFSMGGRTALYIGFSRPDLFGYVGGFCPAPGILDYTDKNAGPAGYTGTGLFTPETFTLSSDYKDNTVVMIARGSNDTIVTDNPKRYHDALEANGIDHIYETYTGGHEKKVYQAGLKKFLENIFK